MKQSRGMSLVESIANVMVGYGVAVATQLLIFPAFGVHVTLAQNLFCAGTNRVVCQPGLVSIGVVPTNSNAVPGTRFNWSRSLSSQRASVAPLMYQELPLSATIMP